MSDFRSEDDPVERFFAECRRREKQRELERNRAMADEEDAVAYLAGILSKKTKKMIASELERGAGFFAEQHMWYGMSVRNEFRRAGFAYNDLLMDGIWYPWLLKAICLPENHVAVSSKIRRKIWNCRINSYLRSLRRPIIRASILASVYATSLGIMLMKAHSEPIYIISVLIMSLFPVYAAGYWIVKYL